MGTVTGKGFTKRWGLQPVLYFRGSVTGVGLVTVWLGSRLSHILWTRSQQKEAEITMGSVIGVCLVAVRPGGRHEPYNMDPGLG